MIALRRKKHLFAPRVSRPHIELRKKRPRRSVVIVQNREETPQNLRRRRERRQNLDNLFYAPTQRINSVSCNFHIARPNCKQLQHGCLIIKQTPQNGIDSDIKYSFWVCFTLDIQPMRDATCVYTYLGVFAMFVLHGIFLTDW